MKTFSDQDYQLDAKYADHEGPPAAPDCRGRTAGGLGGAAPASLDLYGQSRKMLSFVFGHSFRKIKPVSPQVLRIAMEIIEIYVGLRYIPACVTSWPETGERS